MFSYNEMGSVVQKEAWVGPLDWLDDQVKVTLMMMMVTMIGWTS